MQPTQDEGRVLLQERDVGKPEAPLRQQKRSTWILICATTLGIVLFAVVATSWPAPRVKSSQHPLSEIVHLAAINALDERDDRVDAHATSKACAALGANCSDSKCCVGVGLQCYRKDAGWAECKASCTPGPDPSAADGWPWDCKELGSRSPGVALNCSKQSEDCSKSTCCADPGLQCYEKAPGWAACKPACYPGMDLSDADPNPWSCKELGHRSRGMGPWVEKQCAGPGQACLKKACCSSPGEQCVEQNPYYAECAETCPDGWGCKTHGSRTPQPELKPWDIPQSIAPWVAETCTNTGDCSKTRCCSNGGYQCFEKNSTYAQCKGTCSPGPDLYDTDGKSWSCNILGPQTPGWATEPWKERKEVSAWVKKSCGGEFSSDCRESRCCSKVGNMCYEKDKDWAACSPGCVPGVRPGDTSGGNWSCKELGPRTRKPWGKPSLFCFSVVQAPPNYEAALMSSQIGSGYGIWACDEFGVFSTTKFALGDGPDGPIETVTFASAPLVQSKDGTAGNAELFMHAWDAVKGVGKYQGTDWTVKVDPDAVLLPERLRWHLEPHTGENGYVINCAKPYMPEGPMMFGALEAFSRAALDAYFNGVGGCTGQMPWKSYGEDLFMGKCLELLGVSRINDFKIYSDGVCRGVDCADPDAAAFHPKKDPDSWHACLEETKNPGRGKDAGEEGDQWFKDYMASYTR